MYLVALIHDIYWIAILITGLVEKIGELIHQGDPHGDFEKHLGDNVISFLYNKKNKKCTGGKPSSFPFSPFVLLSFFFFFRFFSSLLLCYYFSFTQFILYLFSFSDEISSIEHLNKLYLAKSLLHKTIQCLDLTTQHHTFSHNTASSFLNVTLIYS